MRPSARRRASFAAAAVVLLTLVPAAAAPWTTPTGQLDVSYESGTVPFFLAGGHLTVEGDLTEGLLSLGHADSVFADVPEIIIYDNTDANRSDLPKQHLFTDATLVIHDGGAYWRANASTGRLGGWVEATYGLAVSLPGGAQGEGADEGDSADRASNATDDGNGTDDAAGAPAATFLLFGSALVAELEHEGGPSDLPVFNATISVLDRDGDPYPGFDHRPMNRGASVGDAMSFSSSPDGSDGLSQELPTDEELAAMSPEERQAALEAYEAYLATQEAGDAEPQGQLVRLEGDFMATLRFRAFATDPGPDPDIRLSVATADADAFADTRALVGNVADLFATAGVADHGCDPERDQAPSDPEADADNRTDEANEITPDDNGTATTDASGPDCPSATNEGDDPAAQLALFEPFSGVLNGAVVLIQFDGLAAGAFGAMGPGTSGVTAAFGGQPIGAGFILARGGTSQIDWSAAGTAVTGTPSVVVSTSGIAAPAVSTVALLPVWAIILWVAAIGAVVYHLRRHARGDQETADAVTGEDVAVEAKWRLLGIGTHLVVFLVALLAWDAAFATTFGTSLFTLMDAGSGTVAGPVLGIVAALELIPLVFALVLFGVPVAIVSTIGLRHVAGVRGLGGFAAANAWIATFLLGQGHALWFLGGVLGTVMQRISLFLW